MPTDTIYGVLASANNPAAVEKLYQLRQRASDKPFIILISSQSDLHQFGITLTDEQYRVTRELWPGPVSIILPITLPADRERLHYLHRGSGTLAFRVPAERSLSELLQKTGPVVAPSANPEGKPPATTADEARAYFDDAVDLYVEAGQLVGAPSALIELNPDGSTKVLRGILKH